MTLGTIGQLLLLTSFIASIVSGLGYYRATRIEVQAAYWKNVGRLGWIVMTATTILASALMIYLLATHQFQYYYVFKYSSKDLEMHYLFSAFWAGQEGSFMLWIIWTALVGFILFKTSKDYEPYVMSVIGLCQFFLLSMVLGIKFGTLTIGSSPFQTTAEAFPQAPMLQVPGFIPSDGQGLNDLLKNPWMVIHPPTLFIGFTLMIVPFAYAIAAMWRKQYTQWVKPAMPWALIANLILIIGIVMGGYWAYVTLSFGGYWAWDPVENSSLVPWLIGVAAIHTMIAQKKSASSQKAALFLNVLAFMLVVYSTFLTRSGILGEISVHSFVDLGLYNQLLIWILTMGVLGFGMMAYRWKDLPKPVKESELLSREFMIFSGAMILCALGAVIILGTSAPIAGRIFRNNPSAVPIEFYDTWSLPLAILMALFAGVAQLFWWNKMNVDNLTRVLLKPLGLAIASTALILLFTPFVQGTVKPAAPALASVVQAGISASLNAWWDQYGMSLLLMFLIFTSFFAFYGNGLVLVRIGRGNLKLAGGAITHIGLVFMLFGIITSATFNNTISGDANNSVPVEGSTERKNFVLQKGQSLNVEGYQVKYLNSEPTKEGYRAYVLNFTDQKGRSWTMKPVAYKSKREQWILHPDLKSFFEKDIYVAVNPSASVTGNEPQPQGKAGELKMHMGETKSIDNGKYTIRFRQFDLNIDKKMIPEKVQIAVSSVLEVTNNQTKETRELKPIYVILDDGKNTQQFIQNRVADWGLTVSFAGMDLSKDGKDGQIRLVIEGADVSTAEDWVIVQAYEKPFINLLWVGCFILFGGFMLSFYRRWDEERIRTEMGR